MSKQNKIKFGPVVRFRSLEGDLEIMRAAATQQGQTLSAYLRDAAIARSLEDLGCDTRESALRSIGRAEIGAQDL